MSSPHADQLVSSVHRAILGGLLAVVGIIAFGTTSRALGSGQFVLGLVSLGVLVGCIFWVLSLLEEGLKER
ncbi:hypothetical protein [Haloferax profundi]|uniref:Uncharacterized protein n=1 Tax=Haloferax profundi TaxID=1544718 RepID=A0A0W1SLN1_9EURY|nr:hypothetical protein [Haloferax profundi]KTG27219.1 hypothetical protein AUR66_14570 [Haloferax profundi]